MGPAWDHGCLSPQIAGRLPRHVCAAISVVHKRQEGVACRLAFADVRQPTGKRVRVLFVRLPPQVAAAQAASAVGEEADRHSNARWTVRLRTAAAGCKSAAEEAPTAARQGDAQWARGRGARQRARRLRR